MPPPPQQQQQPSVLEVERELQRLIARKQTAEQHIASLEARLYDLETEYIRETSANHGSILKGLDGYHGIRTTQAVSASQGSAQRKTAASTKKIAEEDRIFSRSSATWRHSVRLCRAATGDSNNDGAEDYSELLQHQHQHQMGGDGSTESDDDDNADADDNIGIMDGDARNGTDEGQTLQQQGSTPIPSSSLNNGSNATSPRRRRLQKKRK